MTETPGRTRVEWSPMRAAIAKRMSEANRDIPQFDVSCKIDLGSSYALVEKLEAAGAGRVTLTALIVAAAARALTAHPKFNAVWDGGDLYIVENVHVGVAFALGDGLIAPALLDVDRRSITQIAGELRDLGERARARRLRPAELTSATFTVSNLGVFDVSSFTAIVTPPQVAILATSCAQVTPAWQDGHWRSATTMEATLSCDHRAVDGADAARFLETFKGALESPNPAAEIAS